MEIRWWNQHEQLISSKKTRGRIFFADCFEEGGLTDIVAVTKDTDECYRRFGKNFNHTRTPKGRQHGNMGDFGTGYVRGQLDKVVKLDITKELSTKRIQVANPEEHSITPAGGFLHYGEVKSDYIQKGSVPGPSKN